MKYIKEIAEQIESKKAVLFLGSGISAAAGLPTWKELLTLCLEEALIRLKNSPVTHSRLLSVRRFIEGNDPLIAGEMLQRTVQREELAKIIQHVIKSRQPLKPTTLHEALALIPWNMVITTNYDRLFEESLPKSREFNTITWDQHNEFLNSMKSGLFSIVKLHGDIEISESIVLSRKDFSKITYGSDALNDCLRSLLTLRTFIFVGHSLRDPDLLHSLELAKRNFSGQSFGPHYVFLSELETEHDYEEFLAEQYRIIVIRIKAGDGDANKWKIYHQELEAILKALDGQALSLRITNKPVLERPSEIFALKSVCESLLQSAIEATGSLRGDVCFIKDGVYELERIIHLPKHPTPDGPISPWQIMGSAFLRRSETKDYINLRDTEKQRDILDSLGHPKCEYRECDKQVRSELAVPIYSDGNRVGILNLESKAVNRYSEGHIHYARHVATRLGWAHYEATVRQEKSNLLREYFKNPQKLHTLMHQRKVIEWANLAFILYEIDYKNGRLISHSIEGPPRRFEPSFEQLGLATEVLRMRCAISYPDAAEAAKKGFISETGRSHFNITGPLKGFPIRFRGHTSSLIVVWCKSLARKNLDQSRWFTVAADRAYRIISLMTENEAKALEFLRGLDAGLERFPELILENAKTLQKSGRHREFIKKCLSLIGNNIGLTRVRLWVRIPGSVNRFRVEYSVVSKSGAGPIQQRMKHDYIGVETNDTSPFTETTINRATHDSFCRRQHKSMFNEADINCDELEKDPEAEWAVAPLLKNGKLWGFISVDNHKFDRDFNRMKGSSLVRFQLLSVDVIAHVIASFPPESLNLPNR